MKEEERCNDPQVGNVEQSVQRLRGKNQRHETVAARFCTEGMKMLKSFDENSISPG